MARRLVHSDGVLSRRAGASVLVLTPSLATPYVLRGTAAQLWDCFAAPTSIEDAASILATRYGIDAAAALASIRPVVRELVGCDALVDAA